MSAVFLMHLVALAGAPAAESASPAAVLLDWTAPDGACPDKAQVLDRIHSLVGGRPVAPGQPMAVRAVAFQDPQGVWRLDLETNGAAGAGVRHVEGASCERVASAAALIVALALRTPEVPAPTMPPQGRPQPAPDRIRRPTIVVAATLVGEDGALPGSGFGPMLGASVVWRRTRLDAVGSYWPSRRASAAAGGDGADIDLVAAGVRACIGFERGDEGARLDLCGGAEAGRLGAEAVGIDGSPSGSAPWYALTTGAFGGTSPRHRLGVRGGFELAHPLRAPSVALADQGDVHRPRGLIVRAEVGFEVRFR